MSVSSLSTDFKFCISNEMIGGGKRSDRLEALFEALQLCGHFEQRDLRYNKNTTAIKATTKPATTATATNGTSNNNNTSNINTSNNSTSNNNTSKNNTSNNNTSNTSTSNNSTSSNNSNNNNGNNNNSNNNFEAKKSVPLWKIKMLQKHFVE